MMKRLQVTLQNAEYLEVRRSARSRGISVAEWARLALAAALERESIDEVDRKLEVIRAAALHNFPSGDIEVILAQIERGYISQ